MALTVQNGSLVVRDGALGTGQGCCCGGGGGGGEPCDIRTRFQGQGGITGHPDLFPQMCRASIEFLGEVKDWILLVQEWMEENGYSTVTVYMPQLELPLCDPEKISSGHVIVYSISADCCGFVPGANHPQHGVNSGKWLAALDLVPASNIDPVYSYAVWDRFPPPMIPPCIENPLP